MYSRNADEQSEHWPGAYFQTTIESLFKEYVLSRRFDMLSLNVS